MFGKEIKLNLLDFKKKYIKDINRADGQVEVSYNLEKKTDIKIKMNEGCKYLSIGQTIANGIMLPHLDLFGNNFSFFQEKIGTRKKFYFINLSVRDLEFSPQLRLQKGVEISLQKNSLINLASCIFYLVRKEDKKEDEKEEQKKPESDFYLEYVSTTKEY